MWPLDVFRRRKYDRRYRAALVVYLGTYMPDVLDTANRQRVEAEVRRLSKGFVDGSAAFRKWAPWESWGALRAVAMAHLSIEPSIPGLSWGELLRGWPKRDPLFGSWDSRASWLLFDFSSAGQAAADAREFLRGHGWNVPDRDPVEKGSLDAIGAWGDKVDRYPHLPGAS
jgi:hypothetical protein